ncbi:hypothetical protein EJD97_010504 [Solanum chilense]|uniref:FAS1 domain-containing protein n=1 Tax=Solanum chilense TaxID=4083 RepID=A0A6N2BQD1_SOLCI|nr:hypothetical protein EJD97_010504 [Solanum chilense]
MSHQKLFPLILLFILLTRAESTVNRFRILEDESTVDVYQILENGGEYNTFIKFLKKTKVGDRINNIAKFGDGVTVLAPTDNAFNNLTNSTSDDEHKLQLLINYHVISKFYEFDELQTVHNPVETLATGEDNEPLGLNFTGKKNQLNVSSGYVVTNVYEKAISISTDPPLAVYKLDKVLVPSEFIDPKSPSSNDAPAPVPVPAPAKAKNGTSDDDEITAEDKPSPITAATTKPNDAKRINVGILCLISCVFLMGQLS